MGALFASCFNLLWKIGNHSDLTFQLGRENSSPLRLGGEKIPLCSPLRRLAELLSLFETIQGFGYEF
jgi:hypothetical protein